MTNHNNVSERAYLERINAELNESLERCRDLLKACRSQLAANSNDETEDGPDEEPGDISA